MASTFADLPSTLETTMAHAHFSLTRLSIAAAACVAAAASTHAQTTTLEKVTVTGRGEPVAGIAGFGDLPLTKAPFQASVLQAEQMRDLGVQRLSDVTRVDAAVSDAYNAEGYWDFLTVRGFVIDNRFNFRRDGLPINAETSIPLDNKERVEILKGTSGLQAGTSAPGGLVNFVVKRPTDGPLRSAMLEWRQAGTLLGALDVSERFGAGQAFGIRVNAAAAHLDPRVRDAKGERNLLAVAGDWRIGADTLLEAELETSHRSQPSVPGFSLLGPALPAPGDPRINLNNQPWSLPVVLDGTTGSLRFSQALGSGWRWTAHAATQRLVSQDRIAFPYGCSAEGNFDRYCSDGTFDLYDFRSENEHRRTDALELALHGTLQTAGIAHSISAGLQGSRVRNRFQQQAFNFVGIGNVQGTAFTAADPSLTDENTNRDERSTEFFARDAIKLSERITAWLGMRHTRLSRDSVRTDGTQPTHFTQSFTTPWLAGSVALGGEMLVYASWGRGVESEVAPNRPRYANLGEALPALQSRQAEIGIKGSRGDTTWSVAWFDIRRPVWADVGADCFSDATPGSCVRQADGVANHRGIEANVGLRWGAWSMQGGLQALQARREGSIDASLNGKRPPNVPAATLKLLTRYEVPAISGLALDANLLAESDRMVLLDNSVRIPGYGRLDLGARYVQRLDPATITWRAGIDNLLDRRAWRESPLQFGHVYLFPLAPRTLRVSMNAAW
jgi:iron complex outermembrane receptor protein